ncbi:unnamed protein product [Rhizoctonia solani]|uniref:Uncharacterized protein n=1 Tax=Rhizoctonia solani TaxID=456999 RepID=A0A8H3HR39_9AGAM|nr:unnamed protein product [Rhizoctonia solani]CAE7184530.1 unnamed protein product [Rhizoctonia solani]
MTRLQKAKDLARATLTLQNLYTRSGFEYYWTLGSRAPGQNGGRVLVAKHALLLSGFLYTEAVSWVGRSELDDMPEPQRQQAIEQRKAAIPWTSDYWQYLLRFPRFSGPYQVNTVCRGDGHSLDFSCWKQVLGPERVGKLDSEKKKIQEKNGMLLEDVAEFSDSEVYSIGEHEILVMKNKSGQHFAFQFIEEYAAKTCTDAPNDRSDLLVVHPVLVNIVDKSALA